MATSATTAYQLNTGVKIPVFGWLLQSLIAAVMLLVVALVVRDFPTARSPIAWGLGIYAIALIRYPWLWMLVIPGMLPILDLNLWSGRVYLSEFDLLVFTTAAIGLLRRDAWVAALDWRPSYWFLLLVIICWQLATTLRGLTPVPNIDTNSFVSFYSHFNSLRLAKGFVLALLLLPLLGQSLARGDRTDRLLIAGMVLSCLCGIGALLWERALFTGLMNFVREYRATGLFSGTATGGAAVDAHLMMTLPFLLLLFLYWRQAWMYLLGGFLGCLGLYACAITFSRANYPALAVALGLFFGGWLYQQLRHNASFRFGKTLMRYWPALLVLPLVAYLLLSNPYISSRFSTTWSDLQTRFDHWGNIISLMDGRRDSGLMGMGKGSFPRRYYWSFADNEVDSTAVHMQTPSEAFIRMSESDHHGSMFLRQRFSFDGAGSYRLKLKLRPTENQKARILVEFCERLVFKAYRECRWLAFDSRGDPEAWEEFNRTINLHGLGQKRWFGSRPVEVSILNRGINQSLDVGAVELYGPSGRQLLANTHFQQGWDRWTLYSGDHLSWHIKNIFVDALFEGGWPGLLIFLAVLFSLALKLWNSIRAGSVLALGLAASLAAGVMVGLFDSLFDEPRITLLFFLLAWATLSLQHPQMQTAPLAHSQAPWIEQGKAFTQHVWSTGRQYFEKFIGMRHRNSWVAGITAMAMISVLWLASQKLSHRHWMDVWNGLFADTSPAEQSVPDYRLNQGGSPGEVLLDGQTRESLAQAFKEARDGSVIRLGAGHYNEAAMLRADNVRIIGEPGSVIFGKAVAGKGALLIRGNNTHIEGIECHSIKVPSNNGACVRLEGNGLTLNRVHFHDSQGGLVGSPAGGDITITNSRFENMGRGGFFHGIYILDGINILRISNSVFLNTQSAGHEIKSRARHTEITDSIIAASVSRDSRLVDVPNSGNLILRNNVFVEGPLSENADLFSWGVEGAKHRGIIVIEDNLIISDKPFANLIAVTGKPISQRASNNLVIGTIFGIDDDKNTVFDDRRSAGIEPAPFIPRLQEKPGN